ncbi:MULTISPECIES: elongation factor G [unclassified Luteimonas]|uniref:elongation factor G n=1 Tax=unclassified Luteimonas TaxID=2629088 RepID=UPI0018F0A6CD|nr:MULTISPECIES: elongation factor G [unclassified Luteimonas]MBJ6978737.1 elongation factor G [Luteimonas sp. MC1895]MBJ6983637.1 elongation factor G [Luteimonas sp. MC1750]QQO06480.1 elongation factor G [Luteimonas sp. MC1750]
MSHATETLRNVALAGHPGAGKTTLFEALLHAGGTLQAAGSIERGSTVSDFDPQERTRGHSIDAAIAAVEHAAPDGTRVHLNLLDTPGYPDFRGAALSALSAADTVAVVVDAAAGIGHGTRRIMDHAARRGLCRAVVVNRIDAEGADCARLLDELRAEFGPVVLPVNLPAGGGTRVVDCFAGEGGDSDLGPVADWHRRILDQVVEVDESVMEHYLDGGEGALGRQELHDAFEQCLREGHLVPVCFASARTGTGVAELLDAIASLFPHPGEANPPPFRRGVGDATEAVASRPDPSAHVIADIFKIVNDPFVGKLGIFRVHQGTVRRDQPLYVDDGRKPFKVAHLYRIHGREHIEIEQAVPGDIAAVAKVDELHFDAVLHDSHDEDHIHLAPMEYPRPMFGLAVEAGSRGQEQKLATALHKLSEEDPCFQVEQDPDTHETVVRGLSELHLRIQLDRLRERHGVEVQSRPPRIAYRETIGGTAEGHHRHKKQTGGAGQFGEVMLRVEPLPRGAGFEFVDAVKGGTIPGQFIPAVEKGVRQALASGAVAGHPIQDVRVVVHDGKHHPVDSKEVAFATAGRKAFLDAVAKASPKVLEPIVDLVVTAPDVHMGDISGGLASRRARIVGTDAARGGDIVVKAQVPLSELDGYPAELQSVTAGRGRYSLDFSHYEPVPAPLQQKLAEAWHPGHEDD